MSARPFVCLHAALTADGKIAPVNRAFIPFGSAWDEERLYALRAETDAIMAGARTVNGGPVTLGPGPARWRRLRRRKGRPEFNLRVIVSGSGRLEPGAEVFRHRFSPILVLTTARCSPRKLARLRAVADEVRICGRAEIDFAAALRWLRRRWQVRRLVCEGGGELNAALLQAGLVDEVYLTFCPFLFGGRDAPTLADGVGAEALAAATPLEWRLVKRRGDELFVHLRVRRRPMRARAEARRTRARKQPRAQRS